MPLFAIRTYCVYSSSWHWCERASCSVNRRDWTLHLSSPRPMWPRGPDWRDHLCSQLPGLYPAAVRQDTVQEHPHDAGTGGSQPHQGEHTANEKQHGLSSILKLQRGWSNANVILSVSSILIYKGAVVGELRKGQTLKDTEQMFKL